jgi:ATP-binding cassette subfamily F protein 3
MGTINIQNVTKQFGGQVVLDNVSIELHSGETVGIVGPNGAGKTTLFRLITGQVRPDLGTVTRSKGMDVGYLPQEPQIGLENTLHDEVLSVFAEIFALERKQQALSEQMAAQSEGPQLDELMKQYDRVTAEFIAAGGYTYEQRLNEILGGLGFTEADRSLPMAALSGGQKCRAALGKLLLQDTSYLLLDEPTNHLDIDAVRWLEKFLAGHHGGAAIVSHDRYLLDRLAERIIEVDRKRLTPYPGNYTNYVKVRGLRELTEQRRYERDQEYIAKEQDFIARNIYGQRTREAQGRRKRLERRLEAGEFSLEKPVPSKSMKLDFTAARRGAGQSPQRKRGTATRSTTVVEIDGAAKRYGDKVLFDNLSVQIDDRQRFGITGPNGTGKTTLARLIVGEVAADAGRVTVAPQAVIGYQAQEPHDLETAGTVLSEILTARPDFDERTARAFLARFLFRGDDVFKAVGRLSGGEQSRLRLAKLLLAAPSILILDEPTNHLDIPAREALEQALEEFPGTIIAVSHDRYFLDRIVKRLLVLRVGEHAQYVGNYSDYIRESEDEAKRSPAAGPPERRPARRREKPARGATGATRERSRFERMPLRELEAFIIDLEEQAARFERKFASPEVYRDGETVARLRAEFDAIRRELAEAEQAWNRRAEQDQP